MKTYRFDTSVLASLFSVARRAKAGSYAQIVGAAAEKAAYLQNDYEKALVEVWAQKALQVVTDAAVALTKENSSEIIEFYWPEDSTGDFAVLYYTEREWSNRDASRPGAKFATRRSAITLTPVDDQAKVMEKIRKAVHKRIPANRRSDMEVRVEVGSAGQLTASLVPTNVTEESPKWLQKAGVAVYTVYPVTPDSQTTLLSINTRGKASLIQPDIESGQLAYEVTDSEFSGGYFKEDMALYVADFDKRIAHFKKKYYDAIRERMRQNKVAPEPVKKERTYREKQDAIDNMEKARLARRQRLASTLKGKEAISLLPFLDHGYASSRRWGIEIESGGARGVTAPAGWSRKRDGSLRSAWEGYEEIGEGTRMERYVVNTVPFENCPSGENHEPELYTVERGYHRNPNAPGRNGNPECNQCGDIYAEREVPNRTVHHAQDDDCAEFVSPILGSMHSKGLEQILTPISQQPQNDSSGVHVHVEALDLTPKQLGSLVYGYDAIEGLIETSYRRNVREYCRLRSTDAMFNILTGIKESTVRNLPKGDRYVTLNLCSLDRHGTVEFRAMGPVYDYDYLVRWAMFCREMVNIAKAGVTAKEWNSVNSWADLTALFAKYGKEYIRTVIDSLGGEVPASPRLDTHDGTVTMPTGGEATPKIVQTGSTFAEYAATMDEVAVNSRWASTVESTLAAIGTGSQRVLVGALASGESEV